MNKLDPEILSSMIPENAGKGTLHEDKKDEELYEKPDIKGETKEKITDMHKYAAEVAKGIAKNPSEYYVETSEGVMSIKEAMAKGWNPDTGEFDLDPVVDDSEAELEGLSENDRNVIKQLTSRSNAQIAPADMSGMLGDAEDMPEEMLAGQSEDEEDVLSV